MGKQNRKNRIAAVVTAVLCAVGVPWTVETETVSADSSTIEVATSGRTAKLWYETLDDGTIAITDCNEGASGALVIPSSIDGASVTEISTAAFESCTGLTEITIPDSVTEIGEFAFESCTDLTEITIPDSVTEIGRWAFHNCGSLIEITIPDSVTKIGEYAFESCNDLTEITILDGVTEIGEYAFFYCENLIEITIPNSVTEIGGGAFYNTPWLEAKQAENPLVVVNGILIDGATCTGEVTIPDSVTEIGDHAFSHCGNLTEITIPDSVTEIGYCAFWSCQSLTEITIPDSVTEIDGSAFSYCENLAAITIPDGVTKIGDSAFCGCASLTEITIPDSVTEIGDSAFYNCENLDDIYYGGTEDEWNALIADVDGLFDYWDEGAGSSYTKDVTVHYNTAPVTTKPAVTTTEAVITTTTTTTTTATASEAIPESTESTPLVTVTPGDLLYGDVNLDGRVDITDAVQLNKACASSVILNESAAANADCNANGSLESGDAVVLLQFLVSVVKTLPYTD